MIKIIPESYKQTFIMGYISIILFATSMFLGLYFNKIYGSINQNWGPITLIIAIVALAFYIYFIIKTSLIKNNPTIYKMAIILVIVGGGLAYLSAQFMG